MPELLLRSALKIASNRQRREFDPIHMQELQSSIETNGLLHPIVTRKTPEGIFLVAGESRVKAIDDLWVLGGTLRHGDQSIPEGFLPHTDLGSLSDLDAEEAELDENIKRRDLTWQELADATRRLHELRGKQRAAAAANAPVSEGEAIQPAVQTVADTAQELRGRADGYNQDKVRQDIILAGHLDNPSIAGAKTAAEAFKILKRQEQEQRNVALATAIGSTFSAKSHRLLQGDCLEWMEDACNHSQFDVILTDPPYGMDADSFGDAAGRLSHATHQYSDDLNSWQSLMSRWSKAAFAVAGSAAHAYLFCDIDNFHELKRLMQNAGWYVFRTPFVYQKINSGRVPRPEHGPRRQYELVLYAIKGDKRVTQIYPDVFSATGDENLGHGAQKPVACFQQLLQRSVRPGDKVLDSFAGTGTIFEACHPFKCEATGIELDPNYYGLAAKRLQDLADLNSASTVIV